ncbi:efflux RND transporter periplasmic adaptor subunit [Halomonas sp. NyZ770]|uniref:efflux RND transporter periplasmic adaptor subunit n=1 Tax=Halomonas sp. NyZ770 TaxID=2883106 RepID=UPI0029CABBDF|nr:efflux RND transporter periplasmic adaptor subunit [Halomonas sp. NyZ770]
MQKKIGVILLAVAIVAGVGIAVVSRNASNNEGPAAGGPPGAMAPRVPVAEVIVRTMTPTVEFTGYLAAPETVELRSRVGGAIDAVSVPEGSLVNKGQLLFQIDPRPFQVALDTAQAQLHQAEVLTAQAQSDFERAERLVSTGAVSRKTYDDAVSARNARQAQVQAAKAAVAAARLDLSYARVTAPIAGRVDRMLVTEGNLVSGGGAGAATLLTTIVSVDPMYVYFDIDEGTYLNHIGNARPDAAKPESSALAVQVGLGKDNNFSFQGTLDFVGNQVDRGTGTVRARAIVPNPDGYLTPGMFARARLATGTARQTILIDDQAVGSDQDRNYVLVVDAESTAQYRPIQLGPMRDGLRVVESGLNEGEQIVLKGLVRPGMPITPNVVPMQQSTGAGDSSDAAVDAEHSDSPAADTRPGEEESRS